MGTVPHGLIAAHGGDTVAAAKAFAARYASEMNVTVLADFDNDSGRTAVEVADALGDDLWGVRLDTSERLVDAGVAGTGEGGVTPALVEHVRERLDAAGHHRVKIAVSGGFDVTKIEAFEAAGVPVDAYGVGSSLLRGANDFTADVVLLDGEHVAKAGRELIPSERLERVT